LPWACFLAISETYMKYEDINPKDLIADQVTAMLADIGMLKSRQQDFVVVPCPACGSASFTPLYKKYDMQHVACRDCETQYISPRPTPSILREFYTNSKNYEYWAKYIFPQTAEARRRNIFKPRAKLVADLCQQQGAGTGLLVEVGAGYGFFCEELKKLGLFKRVIGVEPTPHLAQICRDKGVEVIEELVENIKFEAPADVVVNFEVIEHLFNPKDFLKACFNLLKPGGYLILTCPNIAGFETQTLKRHSDTIDHEHLNYFSPRSLSDLTKRLGFEVMSCHTPGVLDVDIVYDRLQDTSKEAIQVDPFIRKIVCSSDEKVRDEFQAFLTKNGLSSNMMLIARRP
jgi:2-polyprenyl-3-methyl-5-hydroxy-6-metoxy-1,4-benzoquinol methylase